METSKLSLQKETLMLDLAATGRDEVIFEISSRCAEYYPELNADGLAKVLIEREEEGTTGIGDGIAIPHIRSRHLKKMVLAFGRSKKGVDFHALDHEPVYLFFVLLSPHKVNYLKVLSRIARLGKSKDQIQNLLTTDSVDEVYSVLKNALK